MNKNHCAKCGKGEIEVRKVNNFETMIRGVHFTVPEATIRVCKSCGTNLFDPSEIKRWQKLYEADLQLKGHLLTAADIRNIRQALGLQINQFAQLLGTTRQSIYNWERDNRNSPQLKLVDLLLKLIRKSMEIGTVDVVQFLREEAGFDKVMHEDSASRRTRPRRRGRVGRIRLLESCEYERVFGFQGTPSELPRLRMC
jgi:putative zinc finger/helix-turn-helix YgiT family protein